MCDGPIITRRTCLPRRSRVLWRHFCRVTFGGGFDPSSRFFATIAMPVDGANAISDRSRFHFCQDFRHGLAATPTFDLKLSVLHKDTSMCRIIDLLQRSPDRSPLAPSLQPQFDRGAHELNDYPPILRGHFHPGPTPHLREIDPTETQTPQEQADPQPD